MTTLTTRATKGSVLSYSEADANFKQIAQTKGGAYPVAESDNRDTIEVSASTTITLPDASTIASAADTGDFEVTIKNVSGSTVTVTCTTGTDTIEGSTSDYTLYDDAAATFKVNQAANGYNIIAGDVTQTGAQTLTNKTLTSPTLTTPTITDQQVDNINDTNGNESLIITATGSAVNEFTIVNAATGNAPAITATGGDANVDLELTPKGTGNVTWGGDTVCRQQRAEMDLSSSATLTGIPSWAKVITIGMYACDSTSNGDYYLRIGPSGGVETSGYSSRASRIAEESSGGSMDDTAIQGTSSSARFQLTSDRGGGTLSGTIVLSLVDSTDYKWSISGTLTEDGVTDEQHIISGGLDATGVITQLDFTSAGTVSAGDVSVLCVG